MITVELKSSIPLKDLKEAIRNYLENDNTPVLQVQANVIKMDAKTRKTYCRGEH